MHALIALFLAAFCAHEAIAATHDVGLFDAELRQIFTRQVDAPQSGILLNVAQNISQLKRDPACLRRHESRLVFIGRKLDETMLKDGFAACRA